MRITSYVLVAILFSTSLLSQTETNLTITSNTSTTTTSTKKPKSCYLADASEKTSEYFVTASIIYLSAVNLVMPIFSGFILPIVLAKIIHPNSIPESLPVDVVIPIDSDTSLASVKITERGINTDAPEPVSAATVFLSGTANLFGLFANGITYAIANKVSSAGLTVADVGGTTSSGLSAKDIINILTATIGAGAKIWDYVQHALCESDK